MLVRHASPISPMLHNTAHRQQRYYAVSNANHSSAYAQSDLADQTIYSLINCVVCVCVFVL
eukprot:m.257597 g.257597  ORF g.257597 m.257597 type:complete len:61 (+) comp15531_c0_seq1:916-1098(+)